MLHESDKMERPMAPFQHTIKADREKWFCKDAAPGSEKEENAERIMWAELAYDRDPASRVATTLANITDFQGHLLRYPRKPSRPLPVQVWPAEI